MNFGKRTPARFDYRQAPRRPGNFAAAIILPDRARLRCLVKDFSATGAQLMVSTVLGIPDAFTLETAAGNRRRVAVVWRAPARLGVRFV